MSLHHVARDHPDRVAVVAGSDRHTFAEIDAAVARVAGLLAGAVGPGDRVALHLGNRVEYLTVWLAAGRLGALVVPVGHRLTADEVRYIVEDSGASVVVHDRPDVIGDACDGLGVDVLDVEQVNAWSGPAWTDDAFLASMPMPMPYTSGTTGRPKGITRRPPEPASTPTPSFLAAMLGYRAGGVHLVAGPLYHTAPGMHALLNLWEGATVVLLERFESTTALAAIEAERVTSSFMVPAHFVRILEAPWGRYDRSSLERIWHAGAPCPPAVKRAILEVFPGVVWEFYGMSEGMGGMITPDEWVERPGSVGRAFTGLEYCIIDEAGKRLPPGEIGQVFVSSLPGAEFSYHNADDKTAAAWRDGFYTVGDLGHLDEDGYLYLSDRRVDLILRNGVNIYPAEIERALAEHSDVLDSAVFGLPDEQTGERVHALVELRAGSATTPEDLAAHLQRLLAPEKCPAAYELVDRLPREPNGKILKRRLRDERIGP